MKNKEVYLDGASNTSIDKKVFKKMKPFLSPRFVGNSHSIHDFGIKADKAIYEARQTIADCLKVDIESVFFTSGATESNNWAIKSVVFDQLYKKGGKKHIICSATEHDSVLRCCQQMERIGVEVTYVHPKNHYKVTKADIQPLIRKDTYLICVMSVNNETGIENDIEGITSLAYQKKIFTLVDCTQELTYGGKYVELGIKYPKATFFTFSSHKIYGPLGVGCLIVNNKKYQLSPLIVGGAQEKGLRGGTSNTTGIVGMAEALKILHEKDYSIFFIGLLRYLDDKVRQENLAIYLNVLPTHANILSLNCSRFLNSDNLARELSFYGIAVSAGSACDAEHNETEGDFHGSHVLKELGLSNKEIRNTIRISFTKDTTTKDIDKLINILKEIKKNENECCIR